MRASIAAERAGVPSVSIVGSYFEGQARIIAQWLDMEGAPLAVYPGHLPTDDPQTFGEKVLHSIVDQAVEGLTVSAMPSTALAPEPGPRDIILRGHPDDLEEEFHARGWTDGLPVVLPTLERVERFLRCTDRDPGEVLGVLPPERRQATVWNVAVNGVMAGCRPEYMPILLAIVEAVSDPAFRIEDHGSTPGWEPLIVLSGPIAEQLDFNSGIGVMRVGRRANTSVGRFLRLYTRNIAGLRIPPGETDRAGIGNPFNVVLAEDEQAAREIGWPAFGEEHGLARGESAVTVQSMIAASNPMGAYHGPADEARTYLDPLVEVFGKAICGYWFFTAGAFGRWHPLIVMTPPIARELARHGWSKDDVRAYLFEKARVPARWIDAGMAYLGTNLATAVASGTLPPSFAVSDDPERLLPVFIRPEWIGIVVAGNPGKAWQRGYMNNHEQGPPVTKRIVPPGATTG
jgi:hypothetical protein